MRSRSNGRIHHAMYAYRMAFGTLLALHISGAVLTALVALAACGIVLFRTSREYRTVAILLGLLAAFEVLTGTGLAIVSASVTVASVCGNIMLYLLSVAFVLTLLGARIKQESLQFPVLHTISSFGMSFAVIAVGLALGL